MTDKKNFRPSPLVCFICIIPGAVDLLTENMLIKAIALALIILLLGFGWKIETQR